MSTSMSTSRCRPRSALVRGRTGGRRSPPSRPRPRPRRTPPRPQTSPSADHRPVPPDHYARTAVPVHAAPSPPRRRVTLVVLVALCVGGLGAAALLSQGGGDATTDAGAGGGDGDGIVTAAGTAAPRCPPSRTPPPRRRPRQQIRDHAPASPRPGSSRSGATRPAPTTARGRCPRPRGAVELPGPSGGMCAESSVGAETRVWCGSGWTGQPAVFERGRPDVGGVRRLRPGRPLPRRRHRRGHPPAVPDRRHHQGLGHRSTPTASRSSTRARGTTTTTCIAIDRPEPTELWTLSADAVVADACGTTTGTAPAWSSTTTCSRAARTASSTSCKLNRALRRRRPGHGRPRARVQRAGVGRRAARRHRRPRRVDRELGRHLRRHRLLRQLRRPGAGLGHRRPRPTGGDAAPACFRFWTGDDTDAIDRDRRGGHALRRLRVRARQRPQRPRSARS